MKKPGILSEREEMLSLLREVEWIVPSEDSDHCHSYHGYDGPFPVCPFCGGCRPEGNAARFVAEYAEQAKREGVFLRHASTCRLAALLARRSRPQGDRPGGA